MRDAEADALIAKAVALLQAERQRQGLSMLKLAKAAGLDQVAVSRIENGERSPSTRTLLKMTSALGIKLSDVLRKAGG